MQKNKTYLLVILLCLHFFAACAQENIKDVEANVAMTLPDVAQDSNLVKKQDRTEVSVLLYPKSGLTLSAGTECIGIFDKSREVLRLSCKEEDGEKVLYLNDERQFSTADNSIVILYDIAENDAYLELVVAESEMVNSSDFFRVTIYRVHPAGIVDIPIFPQVESNSVLIKDWHWLSFREGIMQVQSEEQDEIHFYQLMPDGYFIPWEEKLIPINANGRIFHIPENNVAISESYSLGIAFEPVYTMASTTHYNIYQSLDGGFSWNLIVEDYIKEIAEFAYIYISDQKTIYCFFEPSGVTETQNILVSEDGGITWSYIEK